MLLFSPELCRADPLETLASAWPHIDAVQVRVKRPGEPDAGASARDTFAWTERVLALRADRAELDVLVLVNDRVDVARVLADRGVDGVHLGQEDCPPRIAREVLGTDLLIGLSTHSNAEVQAAQDQAVDYLGFGPVHATATKGFAQGLGAQAAWIASAGSSLPVFAIGGIDATNAAELAGVGRAAVSSAILGSEDPASSARALALLLACA
jgi:thiamine-phosphate pyrophosphorylase